jgi:hypothetical protein
MKRTLFFLLTLIFCLPSLTLAQGYKSSTATVTLTNAVLAIGEILEIEDSDTDSLKLDPSALYIIDYRDGASRLYSLDSTGVVTLVGITIGSAAILEAELEILDGATVTTAELNLLGGMNNAALDSLADLSAAELEILDGATPTTAQFNKLAIFGAIADAAADSAADLTAAEFEILDGATVTTAELNLLGGMNNVAIDSLADLTAAELEVLDGATLNTTDLNIIDGVGDSGSLTAAELLYVDGVTSAIQTQIDAKEDSLENSAGLLAALDDETGTGVAVFGTAPTFTTSANVNGSLVSDTYNYAADAGASDAYVITLSPAPDAYATGMMVVFKANTANTGAASLDVNSLGAKTILKLTDQALTDNCFEAGSFVIVVYDGTNFQLQTPCAN